MRKKPLTRIPGNEITLTLVAILLFFSSAYSQPRYGPKEEVTAPAKMNLKGDTLNIAFISYANPQQVAYDSEFIVNFLEPLLGRPIRGFITLDYGSSIEAMRGGKADIAFVDPLAFMMAHEQIGAIPLLLEVYDSGQPTYHSSVWVRREGSVSSLEDLEGKTIAFADQVDMSGHLLPRDVFRRAKLLQGDRPEGEFFKQVYFAGGDEQAIRAVLNGFVDAAGISQYAYLLLRPEERDQVKTIADSIESPAHLVMARKDLSREIREKLMEVLMGLDWKNAEDRAVLNKLYGVRGFSTAHLSDFSEVAKIAAHHGFVKNPKLFSK